MCLDSNVTGDQHRPETPLAPVVTRPPVRRLVLPTIELRIGLAGFHQYEVAPRVVPYITLAPCVPSATELRRGIRCAATDLITVTHRMSHEGATQPAAARFPPPGCVAESRQGALRMWNPSHCLNVSPSDAIWFYENADVVGYRSSRGLEHPVGAMPGRQREPPTLAGAGGMRSSRPRIRPSPMRR